MSALARSLLAALALPALTACGGASAADPARILDGADVARMAERQLEAEHDGMAPGEMTCRDLELTAGERARCTRTAHLAEGRWVRVRGTVEVAEVGGDSRLRVRMDEAIADFGLTGAAVARRVRESLAESAAQSAGGSPGVAEAVSCPELSGAIGRTARCAVTFADGRTGVAEVVVTATDAERYQTDTAVRLDAAAGEHAG